MPDAISLLWFIASIVAMAEGLRKIIVHRAFRFGASTDYLALGLVLISLSLAVGAPATLVRVTHLTGMDNLAATARDVLQVAAVATSAGLLRVLEQTRLRIRASGALFTVCATAMIVLYLAGGRTDPAFGTTADPNPASRAYALIYLSYMVTLLALYVRGLWRVARRDERIMRIAIMVAVAGVTLAVSGLVWRLGVTVYAVVAPVSSQGYVQFALVAEPCGVIVFAVGSALVATVRHVSDCCDRQREARHHAAVDSLWTLLEPVRADTAAGERRKPSLQQKVVAIFDARILLRTYGCPDFAQHVAAAITHRGVARRHAALTAEAVELRVLLDRYLDASVGSPEVTPDDTTMGDGVEAGPEEHFVFVDERQEMANLAALAELMSTPLVADLARTVQRRDCGHSERAA